MKRPAHIFVTALIVFGTVLLLTQPAHSDAMIRVWVTYSAEGGAGARAAMGEVVYRFPAQQAEVLTIPASQLGALEAAPGVLRVEVDTPRSLITPVSVAPAPQSTEPDEQVIPYGVEAVQALDVWDTNHDSQPDSSDGVGVVVCIIDTGVDATHPDLTGTALSGHSQIEQGWDADGHGHGTHIAGTVAAVNNAEGVVGGAPGVSIVAMRIFTDEGYETAASDVVAAAYTCAEAGADIITMSFGYGWPSSAEQAAMDDLYHNHGILLIAAAGNNSSTQHSYPASYASVISVAAVNDAGERAFFSQRTPAVELAAPGVDVLSTLPGESYGIMSGTSMAVPHVAAAAALAWSHHPAATVEQIRWALGASAADLGEPGRDDDTGCGLVQAADAVAYLNADMLPGGSFEEGTAGWTVTGAPGEVLPVPVTPHGERALVWHNPNGVAAAAQPVELSGQAGDVVRVAFSAAGRDLPEGTWVGARVTFHTAGGAQHVTCAVPLSGTQVFRPVGCSAPAPADFERITVMVGWRGQGAGLAAVDGVVVYRSAGG